MIQQRIGRAHGLDKNAIDERCQQKPGKCGWHDQATDFTACICSYKCAAASPGALLPVIRRPTMAKRRLQAAAAANDVSILPPSAPKPVSKTNGDATFEAIHLD